MAERLSMERMKALDLVFGLPLCAALGTIAWFFPGLYWRRRDPAEEPRRILVMKFFGLGSIALAGPSLRAIRERYPRAKLIFMTFESQAALVRRLCLCDEVWVIRTAGFATFLRDACRHLLRFSRDPIDACIDLEFFSKFSTLMVFLTRAPVRVAFHLNSFWRYSAISRPVYYNYHRHVSEIYADTADAIGAPVQNQAPVPLRLEPELTERARGLLTAVGWNGTDRLVGVNVNAGDLAHERRWPTERFAEILEQLAAEPGVCAVLTGAPDEADYVEGVMSQLSPAARARVLNVAGKLSFDEFLATLTLLDFYLTNDSGPLHLAAIQGVDTISLWGVGRPGFYGPREPSHATLYRNFHCSPCLYMFTSLPGQWCGHRGDCVRALTVADVWEVVKAYLTTPRGQRAAVARREGW